MCNIKIAVSKKYYPSLKKRILWYIFPKFKQVGWCWYHYIFPEKLLKKFNKQFIPWKITLKYGGDY